MFLFNLFMMDIIIDQTQRGGPKIHPNNNNSSIKSSESNKKSEREKTELHFVQTNQFLLRIKMLVWLRREEGRGLKRNVIDCR